MKCMLINPPYLKDYSRQSRSPCVAKSGTIYYAYYLAYAGCALEAAGHSVVHFDAIIEDLDHDQSVAKVVQEKPALVLIDTSTPSIINDILFAKAVKAVVPQAKIILCGTFPSKNTVEFFDLCRELDFNIDFAVRGEYEESIVALANAFSDGKQGESVEGVAYLSAENELVLNGEPQKISEEFLENLPFVSEYYLRHFGEAGIRRHFYASINWPYIQILTARGCPYKCTFCNIPSIGSYRTRSVENVIKEFQFIAEKMPFVKEVFVEDDTFPINKKRTIELCDKLAELDTGLTWSCNARVNTDEETLTSMYKAGCRLTCVGFESPSADGLVGVIKKTSLNQQEEYMESADKVGLKVNGCFILGLPGDNRSSIEETIKYSIKLQPNTVQFYPHMLYPGTESFNWAEKEGLLTHKDWSKWLTPDGFHNTPLHLPDMTSSELLDKCDEARLRFYSNPKYLLKMVVQSLSSPKEAQRMFIAGKKFFPLLIGYLKRKLSS